MLSLRKEDQRVTKEQKKRLLDLMRESRGIEDRKEKEEHWQKCQDVLNKMGPARKSLIQWKKIWKDMRCATKKKLLEIKRTRPGSPCPIELSREDHEIIDIVGAGSDYFEEGGEGRELMCFEYAQPSDENCLTELANESGQMNTRRNKEPLEEPTIDSNQPKKIKIVLPPPPPPEDETRKVVYSSSRATNSFGMDDKVLSTLLESIASASKSQRQKRDLPDPDKLFLLSFVNSLKAVPDEYKFDIKADIINVFRKWHEKLGYDQPQRNEQGTSSDNLNSLHNVHSNQHHQTHSSNHSTLHQENGNVPY